MFRNLIDHTVKIGCLGFFTFLGVMSLTSAIECIAPGPFILEEFAVKMLAGLAFAGVGLGAAYFLYGHEYLYPLWQKYRLERLGDRPWMRKRVWRTGRIPYRKPAPTVFLWIFALGWNAGLVTVLWGNRDMLAVTVKENWPTVFPMGLFVLIGLGVLAGAIRSTFAKRTAARALFVMASVPAWTGEILEGVIQTRIPIAMKGLVKLKLTSTVGVPMVAEVPPERLVEGPEGLTIPVVFEIPAGSAPTDEFDPAQKVVWQLEAQMKLPKEDFEARFELPVYQKASMA